jgi:hypothetical protein
VRLNFVFFTDSVSELYGQRMYYSVTSYTVIHFSNIPLFTCYLSCHGCMYDAIVSIERCLSTNDINKCVCR